MSLRWGIIGTGDVAKQIAQAMTFLGMSITAVASRSKEKAQAFARQYAVDTATDDYALLCQRSDVDIVYIDLPHTLHYSITMCALSNGKHVLCEKPIALNEKQAAQMFSFAKQQGLVLMEAMWTRHLPLLKRIVALVNSEKLGGPRLLKADFTIDDGMRFPNHRLLNPELAGGALLDTGIYPLTLASMLFGDAPNILWSQAHIAGGVDMDNHTILEYPGGKHAILYSGISGSLPEEALILCEKGYVQLHQFFYAQQAVVCCNGVVETINEPFPCNGYEFQLKHMEQCVIEKWPESPVVSHSCSLNILKLMDRLRAQWGLTYPQEQGGSPV